MTIKDTGKSLEALWNLLQEVENLKPFKDNNGNIKLPCHPSNFSAEDNHTRRNMVNYLFSEGGITYPKRIRTRVRNEDYFYWRISEGNKYQEIYEQAKRKLKFYGKINKTKLLKEIRKITNSERFKRSRQAKKLLTILSDLESHQITALVEKEVSKSANALSHLVDEVNTKLSDTNFFIDSLPGEFSDPRGSYQLKPKISSN